MFIRKQPPSYTDSACSRMDPFRKGMKPLRLPPTNRVQKSFRFFETLGALPALSLYVEDIGL